MGTKTRWTVEIKEKARKMRLDGSTYGQIQQEIANISKSTLNEWFKGLPRPRHMYYLDQVGWMKHIRELSSEAIRRKKNAKIEGIAKRVRDEVMSWDFLRVEEVQKSFLGLLYWAEGQKMPEKTATLKFTNTDPKLILLYLTMLRKCYQIDEKKLRIRLHVHWYHDIEKVRRFWSSLLNVEESKFNKVYIKRRSQTKRFKKNFAGICFVIYHNVDLRREVMEVGYNIAEVIGGKIPVYTA